MKDYKKMWDNLYKYIQKWNDSIDLEADLKVYTKTEIDMVRRLTRRYTLSTVLDEMMDIEADAKKTEQLYNTLIRCEDCMHYVPGAYNKKVGVCKKFGLKPLGEWYCASGVRKYASETEPEILRCKDCANYELKGYCNTLQRVVSPYSYCYMAKEVKK